MLAPIRLLCEKLTEGADQGTWGPPCDISAWTRYCTFDIQSSLCFGKSLNMLEEADNRYILSLITAIGRRNSTVCAYSTSWHLLNDVTNIMKSASHSLASASSSWIFHTLYIIFLTYFATISG
jgi:hypothetical protein